MYAYMQEIKVAKACTVLQRFEKPACRLFEQIQEVKKIYSLLSPYLNPFIRAGVTVSKEQPDSQAICYRQKSCSGSCMGCLQAWAKKRIADAGLPTPSSIHMISSVKQLGVKDLLSELQSSAGPAGDIWVVRCFQGLLQRSIWSSLRSATFLRSDYDGIHF